MKKNLLKSLLVAAALTMGTSAWADTETVTVLSEDYESYNVGDITEAMKGKGWTFQSRNNKNQITIVQGAEGAANPTKYFDFYYPDGGASRNQSWNFGAASSLNADNWTLSFAAALDPGVNNSANKFYITGANSGKVTSANDDLTNTIFKLVATGQALVEYTPTIGSKAYDNITLAKGEWFIFTITATAISEDFKTATLGVKIASIDGIDIVFEETVENYDLATSGNLTGLCWNSPRGWSRLSLDNVLLTKEVSADVCAEPTFALTGVDGPARKFALACETVGSTIYYANAEIEKGAEGWTVYEGEVTTEDEKIYAYAAKGAITSEIISFETGAGTAVALNAPSIQATGFAVNGEKLNAILTASDNQANVLFTPVSTLTALFNGNAVELPFTVTEDGILSVTASAEGYTSATTEMKVYGNYKQSWESADYSQLVNEQDIIAVLGENWVKQEATGRWASWTSANEPYTYYAAVGESSVFDVTVENNLKMRNVVLLNVGYGLARNVTGGENINFLNSEAGTIAEIKYYNGYGSAVSETNTHLTYRFNDGTGIQPFATTNGNVLVQVKYYEPSDVADGINTVKAAEQTAAIYNLQGQRVMNAQKGLFIVNGKKVVK